MVPERTIEAGPADRPVRSTARNRIREIAFEAAVLLALTAVVACVYVWTKAPLYNPFDTIDPWLYTALWTNFHQIYEEFSTTYYVSRVPWIAPGAALNAVVDERTSYFLLHSFFFLAGALLLYLACRRHFGRTPALCGYVMLIGNQIYFSAHRWDYEEGGVLTFLIGSAAFLMLQPTGSAARLLTISASGFCAAALAATRIVDVAYLIGLPLIYWALLDAERGSRLRATLRDLAVFAAGVAVLLLTCGAFARAYGAEFFFFMPQIRVLGETSGGENQLPVGLWFPTTSYFFVPLFVVLAAAVLVLQGAPRDRRARRLLVGLSAWTAASFAGIAAWEFGATGWVFELVYYFSSFVPIVVFSATGVIAGILDLARERRWAQERLLLAVTVAVLAPLVWLFREDLRSRSAHGVFEGAYLVTLLLMVGGLFMLIAFRRLRAHPLMLASGIFVLAVSFGFDASERTLSYASSDPRTGDLYDVGTQLTRHLRESGYESELPYFWFDATHDRGAFRSLQSLYYASYTYVGDALPTVDEDFRFRMGLYRPTRLVLLCAQRGCGRAPAALAEDGFPARLERRRLLQSGDVRAWVEIYRLRERPASAQS